MDVRAPFHRIADGATLKVSHPAFAFGCKTCKLCCTFSLRISCEWKAIGPSKAEGGIVTWCVI